MSLTGKLILGFLFALVLQISQMVISGYFTAKLQDATEQVSAALSANLAVQNGIDAVRQLGVSIASDLGEPESRIDLAVYHVYLDEVRAQTESFRDTLAFTAGTVYGQVAEPLRTAAESLAALAGREAQDLRDEVSFFEDSVHDLKQAMLRAQFDIKALGVNGVEREQEVHGLPVRAGLIVTLGGVILMAAFVAWFRRQLVIPIEKAWAELEERVDDRTAALATSVAELEGEILERQRVESQKDELHRKLVDTSRLAGMAELANGVLHNVGNVLNSVNTSSTLLLDGLRKSKVDGLKRALTLLDQHEHNLGDFLTNSEQGQMLPRYLSQLSEHLLQERGALVDEAGDLSARVGHMIEIVSRQQSYARVSGAMSTTRMSTILEEVLSMHLVSFEECDVRVVKRFQFDEDIAVDRSRVMQILMNLVANAKRAIRDHRAEGGTLELTIFRSDEDRVGVIVKDDGIGISEEGLTKVFVHGFTTKNDGHGFGLHHSANAATEMGGRLWAESEGPGMGTAFMLELPLRQQEPAGLTANQRTTEGAKA
ncbi:MAG: C4-dicarboxylate-specific signal transduction histidine kinase [Planctomycetota bacterium]